MTRARHSANGAPANAGFSVSVIIPVRDRKELLAEAVASVLRQTAAPLEIIIVDDGSETPVEVASFGLKAARPDIRVVPLAACGMPGKARNAGADEARGEWLAFLDSDDLWLPEKLELQLKTLRERPGSRFSHTREIWLKDGREKSQASQRHRREGDLFSDSLRKCVIGPSTVLMDRALFFEAGRFREDLEIAEDYEFWLRVCDRVSVAYVATPLVIKRAGPWPCLSAKYPMIETFRMRALENLVLSGSLSAARVPAARAELARKYRIVSSGAAKRGRPAEAEDLLRKAAAIEAGAPDRTRT